MFDFIFVSLTIYKITNLESRLMLCYKFNLFENVFSSNKLTETKK